ncbi:hypothetical protein [Mesorhizobium sp.]|uniref:hypothetical protein n=1 Tax=Mesorhizobium sp. TaxID=1871066 RepID=UPI000FE98CF6|nr:hypothetical protein [Mesorhizobium sp.]RWP39078.1 MAG: hypothetical protein EOR05_34260 [Mesorhizobium sp.]
MAVHVRHIFYAPWGRCGFYGVDLSQSQANTIRFGKRKKNKIDYDVSNLNQIGYSCASNMENLLNLKKQMLAPLKEECVAIGKILESNRSVNEIVRMSESLRTFFLGMPVVGIMEFPGPKDVAFALDDIPMLLAIIHKTEFTMSDLNERIKSRNAYIDKQAMQNIKGMNPQAVMYYFQMIYAESMNMIQYVDDALFFNDLLADQVSSYCRYRYPHKKSVKFDIPGENLKDMPPKDYVKSYRVQFRDFSTEPVEPKMFTLADAYSGKRWQDNVV